MQPVSYCPSCKRNVTPKKKFNWLICIFLCGIFYIIYYLLQKPVCPICNGTSFQAAKAD